MKILVTKEFDEKYIDLSLKPQVIAIGDAIAVNAGDTPYIDISDFDSRLFSFSDELLDIVMNLYTLLEENKIEEIETLKEKSKDILLQILKG